MYNGAKFFENALSLFICYLFIFFYRLLERIVLFECFVHVRFMLINFSIINYFVKF